MRQRLASRRRRHRSSGNAYINHAILVLYNAESGRRPGDGGGPDMNRKYMQSPGILGRLGGGSGGGGGRRAPVHNGSAAGQRPAGEGISGGKLMRDMSRR